MYEKFLELLQQIETDENASVIGRKMQLLEVYEDIVRVWDQLLPIEGAVLFRRVAEVNKLLE